MSAPSRRALLGGFATLPLVALVSSPPLIAACGGRPPETPLAHLYGREWVRGAYGLYATKYAGVQSEADASSRDAYRMLAQRGVSALDALQSREVPFYIRVDQGERAFAVERQSLERLTFTADMSDADRKAAESAWKKARDHVHADYEDIRRLDWALTRLLAQVQHVRYAVDEGRVEQYRLVEQIAALEGDPTSLPYELPYQVTPSDYKEILLLLLERLEHDRARLAELEAGVVTVGMTVRSADANSATMAASVRKVLLAANEGGTIGARDAAYPEAGDDRAGALAAGRKLYAQIAASAEYAAWRASEREKRLAALGAFLQAIDQMTGLPVSAAYRAVLDFWRGDRDYFGYLKALVRFVPHGGALMRVVEEAIAYTEKARKVGQVVAAGVKAARGEGLEALVARASSQAAERAEGALLNAGSRFALERADRQLSFFKDKLEVDKITELLNQTELMRRAMPSLPNLAGEGAPGAGSAR
jgi:hypothetical protein